MVAPSPRSNPIAILQKYKDQTMYYYEGWKSAEKKSEDNYKLYKHSIDLLIKTLKAKRELENRPLEVQEVIKEVPKVIIKEVEKEVLKDCDHYDEISNLSNKIKLLQLSNKASKHRYEAALTQSKLLREMVLDRSNRLEKKYKKRSKISATYIYLSSVYILTSLLWMLI